MVLFTVKCTEEEREQIKKLLLRIKSEQPGRIKFNAEIIIEALEKMKEE